MDKLLPEFRLDPATWFYLSSLLVIALYFRFSRAWSLRNLDLTLLLLLSPGLLLIDAVSSIGYVWLFCVSALVLARLLADGLFRRRTRGPQNLNLAGLMFLMVSCSLFHVVETFTTTRMPASSIETTSRAQRLVHRQDASHLESTAAKDQEPAIGPAAAVLSAPAIGISQAVTGRSTARVPVDESNRFVDLASRITAVAANASVILALLFLGGRLFNDWSVGVAMATLYLILPCTAYHVAYVNHLLPGALILWAVIGYRSPYLAGSLIGLACGTLFFPVFLLPLWALFYGGKNALRFCGAVLGVWVALLGSIALTSSNTDSFLQQVVGQIDGSMVLFSGMKTTGLWAGIDGIYRMPVFVLYLVMVGLLSWWTRNRTVEELLARSTALIVGTQFWYPYEGGMYLLWYVPLALAVAFRPALPHAVPPPAAPWSRWWSHGQTTPAVVPPPEVTPAGSPAGKSPGEPQAMPVLKKNKPLRDSTSPVARLS